MTTENISQVYEMIRRLKKEKNFLILAHLYEDLAVQKAADFCGDSFELAKRAKASQAENILFCGVRFMGESAKLLCPEKHVFLPCPDAGCAMADMVSGADIRALKEAHPNAAVVCYINSGAETKAECDVCVTSSNALGIVRSLKEKEVIFVPDKNLGAYIAARVPEKKFILHNGYCPVHEHITTAMVQKARNAHPDAALLVHPECEPAVAALADYTGSTSGILRYAKESDGKNFIIGTEKAVCERLAEECPDKNFYLLADSLICKDMKKATLDDVLDVLQSPDASREVTLDAHTASLAAGCLTRMMHIAMEIQK